MLDVKEFAWSRTVVIQLQNCEKKAQTELPNLDNPTEHPIVKPKTSKHQDVNLRKRFNCCKSTIKNLVSNKQIEGQDLIRLRNIYKTIPGCTFVSLQQLHTLVTIFNILKIVLCASHFYFVKSCKAHTTPKAFKVIGPAKIIPKLSHFEFSL